MLLTLAGGVHRGDFSTGPRILYLCFGLAVFSWMGLMLAAFILAIIGLVECVNAPERYQQGRTQAIATLILCTSTGLLMIFAVVAARPQRGLLAKQPISGAPLVFGDLNFRFLAPAKPWAQADLAKLNTYAKLALLRVRPDVYFLVIAEKDRAAILSTEALAEIGQTRMRSLADSLKILGRSPQKVGRLNGLMIESDVQLGVGRLFYVQWYCATNGWAYQLLAW